MREFNVRAYEDHWIVQEDGGGDPIIVVKEELIEVLAWQPWVAPAKVIAKKRKRRTKSEIAASMKYTKVDTPGSTTV